MKKFLAMAVAASALSIAAPAAAQSWQSINERQANLEQRIDAGVRNGSLTRSEAADLRREF
jgi:opacity protein-like surface antigen